MPVLLVLCFGQDIVETAAGFDVGVEMELLGSLSGSLSGSSSKKCLSGFRQLCQCHELSIWSSWHWSDNDELKLNSSQVFSSAFLSDPNRRSGSAPFVRGKAGE